MRLPSGFGSVVVLNNMSECECLGFVRCFFRLCGVFSWLTCVYFLQGSVVVVELFKAHIDALVRGLSGIAFCFAPVLRVLHLAGLSLSCVF